LLRIFIKLNLKDSVHYVNVVVLMSENGLSFQICGTSEDSEALRENRIAVVKGLLGFNEKKTSLVIDYIWVFMRDRKNRVVGGALGYTFGDWLHIEILWVEETFRNKGNGTKLLRMAENEAVKRGCKHVDLDTMSWQARPFYEKHGYTVFATLDNYPEGYRRHFMKKDLP
jgi:ribosomal protein S18 acetylase RimI-like enzyme